MERAMIGILMLLAAAEEPFELASTSVIGIADPTADERESRHPMWTAVDGDPCWVRMMYFWWDRLRSRQRHPLDVWSDLEENKSNLMRIEEARSVLPSKGDCSVLQNRKDCVRLDAYYSSRAFALLEIQDCHW
jgi:hypothetical protein